MYFLNNFRNFIEKWNYCILKPTVHFAFQINCCNILDIMQSLLLLLATAISGIGNVSKVIQKGSALRQPGRDKNYGAIGENTCGKGFKALIFKNDVIFNAILHICMHANNYGPVTPVRRLA